MQIIVCGCHSGMVDKYHYDTHTLLLILANWINFEPEKNYYPHVGKLCTLRFISVHMHYRA